MKKPMMMDVTDTEDAADAATNSPEEFGAGEPGKTPPKKKPMPPKKTVNPGAKQFALPREKSPPRKGK